MFTRSLLIGLTILGLATEVHAGFYSSMDNRQHEMPYSMDYGGVFFKVLGDLKSIAVANPESNPPIRRRYLLMEALAPGGTPQLSTLEQKLNYSAVLIRRGEPDLAARFLGGVNDEHRKNFLVLSHFASACFLSKENNRKLQARNLMKMALDTWPKTWADVDEKQKTFLLSFASDFELDFDRYRRSEECFERLIINRLNEKKRLDERKAIEPGVDPIFVDDKGVPLKFVNDKGEFEAGRIADSAKKHLPRDAVEVVEQLLLWMPDDQRLLWLLGEAFNATAMDESTKIAKEQRLTSAAVIFRQLTENPVNNPALSDKDIQASNRVLQAYMAALKGEQPKLPDDEPPSPWWRIGGGFAVGILVGMFALWQIQELRRRRAARAGKA